LKEKGIANDDIMMANMVLAKNYQASNDLDQAITNYKQVISAGRSEFAAEAQYRLAEIQFQQHQLGGAEKIAFEVIKKWGSYELWVAKSYVLLGDIYFEQKIFLMQKQLLKVWSKIPTFQILRFKLRKN